MKRLLQIYLYPFGCTYKKENGMTEITPSIENNRFQAFFIMDFYEATVVGLLTISLQPFDRLCLQ